MILGPVSLVDCAVFVLFLAPQLLLNVGVLQTLVVAAKALPHILFQAPFQFLEERYWSPAATRSEFVQTSSPFEDYVIRCVRYAFRYIDASVGRVFFSKYVALPFVRWRLLRHGYLHFPVDWREVAFGKDQSHFKGVWISHRPETPPDFVLYYVHGGGFAMGSAYFYLEFLMVWHHLLVEAGFQNPAIFALEYTLVPDDVYPKQLLECMHGYGHVLETAKDPSKVCVAGDSAGSTIILSLLQELGDKRKSKKKRTLPTSARTVSESMISSLSLPRMCVLISPWITLKSNHHYPSDSDYLNRRTLWKYAEEYAGKSIDQPSASPGSCVDGTLWKVASPSCGYYVIFGDEEVFAPDIERFVAQQEVAGVRISADKISGGIHAWPVASLFLSDTEEKRLAGLRSIVAQIRSRFQEPLDKKGKGLR